jgi:hypothetical protein
MFSLEGVDIGAVEVHTERMERGVDFLTMRTVCISEVVR